MCPEAHFLMGRQPLASVRSTVFAMQSRTVGPGRWKSRRGATATSRMPTLPEPPTCRWVGRDAVIAGAGWGLRFCEGCEETEAPRADELQILRDLKARTAAAHGAEGE